jgi:HAD superfamily hydrolase (TIGR01509 family)
MKPYLSSLGIKEAEMHELLEARRAFARDVLGRPRTGAVETLRELRARGLRTGLITVCSEDTVDVWAETPFAGLFDAEVFSCSCGWRKPDPRIYARALDQLGVEAADAIFVGDGANDELAGAERVGMRLAGTADLVDSRGARAALEAAQQLEELAGRVDPDVCRVEQRARRLG